MDILRIGRCIKMAKKQKYVIMIPHGKVVIVSDQDNENGSYVSSTLQKRIDLVSDAFK